MGKLHIREDFRRDGLCMNFLADSEIMTDLSRAFPESMINIGYPATCSNEAIMCRKIIKGLENENIEAAVVGHSLPSHLDLMADIANSAPNTSANFWIPVSDYMIGQTMKKESSEVLNHAINMVNHWKNISNRPLDVAFVDVTSSEESLSDRAYHFYKSLRDEGVRNVILCDTKGIATPDKINHLLKPFGKDLANLEYHPHDDNGKALENIDMAVDLGLRGVGTAVFGFGERGTMIDPRILASKYDFSYNADEFNTFEIKYNKLIKSLNETEQIFTSNTVVTGTQYRLLDRNPALEKKFGVTSDKQLLSELANIDKSDISDKLLEYMKNGLYEDRKRVYSSFELKNKVEMYRDVCKK